MAFDGIITSALSVELADRITNGRINKIYQPEQDELVLNIYANQENYKLYATTDSSAACIAFIKDNLTNPPQPSPFCMLLRKRLQGGHIISVSQKGSERIIEIVIETRDDLGFPVNNRLIFEIMGKHSNIILVNDKTGKIIDCIKHISIDVNRVRQLLPGLTYMYPPPQNKIPYDMATPGQLADAGTTSKAILSHIGGICPAIARELSSCENRGEFIENIKASIKNRSFVPRLYIDENGAPREFHIADLSEYEDSCRRIDFSRLSDAIIYFFEHKESSNRARQKANNLVHAVKKALEREYRKKQNLSEDLLAAENSDDFRLYGELLTANMHAIDNGAKSAKLENYYNGEMLEIPLDPRLTPNENAQKYYKAYSKSKTAIRAKKIQLDENEKNILYLESVLTFLENATDVPEIDVLRTELEDTGYIRKHSKDRNKKKKSFRGEPKRFETSDGNTVLVGRNNRENDQLTFSIASRNDIWFHTKDIPGSHVILRSEGNQPNEASILEAARIAAYFSKGRDSVNVPVDYTAVKNVRKPNGAKPGMVIFRHNRTVWVDPIKPKEADEINQVQI